MAWTDLEIANMALVRMGIHKQLTALPDTSSEGKALAVLLPKVKERVLSAYPWSWALRHVTLTAATGAPATLPFGWTYAYDKPADMLRPVRLWDGARRFPLEDTLPFQVAPVRAALAVGTVTQEQPVDRTTAAAGSFVITGTPTVACEVMLLAHGAGFIDDAGDPANMVYVFKDGAFMGSADLDDLKTPIDGSLYGIAGLTFTQTLPETGNYKLGETYTFSVTGTEATAAATEYVLTDASDAELIYITNGWLAATPTVTPPSCIDDVVAWLLAAELAMPLAKRPDLSGALAKTAAAELRRAQALDRGAVAQDPSPIPYNLRARG